MVDNGVSLVFIEVCINGNKVRALIDTGASTSLLQDSVAQLCHLEVHSVPQTLAAVGGSSLSSIGSCRCSLTVASVPMKEACFQVLQDQHLKYPLILGADFFKNNQLVLHAKERKIHQYLTPTRESFVSIHWDEHGIPISYQYINVPCNAQSEVTLKAGTSAEVPVAFVQAPDNDHLLLYSDDKMESDIADRVRGVAGMCCSEMKTVLLIATEDTRIKSGQTVGSLSSILEIPEEEQPASRMSGWSTAALEGAIKLSHLSTNEQQRVYDMLTSVLPVLSTGDNDIGSASVTKHSIRLYDETPIYQRPRRVPGPLADEIERQCQELCALDIIEPSVSPWSSPIVPIRKKDGSIRLCIDYRKLNKVTIPDKFPVPNLTDSIFGLKGTTYFTSLDLVRGYYQVPLDDASKPCTAFTSPRNHWQFKRLSFGLTNAPSAFQREIQAVLTSFPSNKVIVYIDDILIMGSTFGEHLELVQKVLATLQRYHIKVKPSKCHWFQSEVTFLGHLVSESGIRKTPEYFNKVDEYPQPKTVRELREFLGFINFQRKFLPKCSELQKPLSALTGGNKRQVLNWSPEMLQSFKSLKAEMKNDMELAYPDYSEEAEKLELWVDASGIGAGAYLAQKQDGDHRVIGFASMTFSPAQLRYSTLERELTALRWGVKTFKPFLYGIHSCFLQTINRWSISII